MPGDVPSNLTVKEMEESGAPVSALRQWYDKVKGPSGALQRAKLHAAAAGQGVRQGGESLVAGGLLGAIHAKVGLDIKGKAPADAIAGVAFLVAGAAFAHEEFGVDLRNTGSAALAVFGFRKTEAFVAEKLKAKGQTPGGSKVAGDDWGAEDPIVAAARYL